MTRDSALTEKQPLKRKQKAQKPKNGHTYTIGFRLDTEYLTKLETIASKRGNSIHEQAREMLMALLIGDETELLAMRMTLDAINEKFDHFAVGMADTLEAIFIMSGATEEKAKAFIEERLRRRGNSQ